MSDDLSPLGDQLFQSVKQLVDDAKQRAAVAINAELTLLYWQVGTRIQTEILQNERADYGKQVIVNLSKRLTQTYGKGWREKQLRHCLHFSTTFPDDSIVSALRRQLSWTHIKTLMYIGDSLKRDFYIEICQIEGWSSRQLQERLNSMLYERTALSRKPKETIRTGLAKLIQERRVRCECLDSTCLDSTVVMASNVHIEKVEEVVISA